MGFLELKIFLCDCPGKSERKAQRIGKKVLANNRAYAKAKEAYKQNHVEPSSEQRPNNQNREHGQVHSFQNVPVVNSKR